MRHIKQRYRECVPTSLAMVLDVHPDTIIGAASKDGRTWNPSTYTGDAIPCLHALAPWAVNALVRYINHYQHDKKPPRKGRGLILQRFDYHGHAVAFENGRVYNPEEYAPRDIRQWWQEQEQRGAKMYIALKR